jgi:hypothetical protein
MGPFSFLNGAFLVALAAAILPILIHLFSRRRVQEMPFSQLRFLDEITRRKIRRMRLRQWLLLAMRTLAIALIALALSRPVWHGPGANRQRGSSAVAILIDDSFSMEARLDAGTLLPIETATTTMSFPTRFEQARQRALQLVDLLGEGDQAILVFAASPPRVPYESTVRDPALLREEILRAVPRATRADLVGALERVGPALRSARTLNRELFVVSDFQQVDARELLRRFGADAQAAATPPATADSTRRAAGADDGKAGASRALLTLPDQTRLYLLPVQAPAEPNLALIWGFYEPFPGEAGGRLTVRARNHSEQAVADGVLQVLAGDGTILAEGMIGIEPNSVGQAVISVPATPADGELVVQAPPDLLERDNRHFVGTAATTRFKLLIVTGGSRNDPQVLEELTYPVLALDPFGGAALLEPDAGTEANRAAGEAQRDAQAQGVQLFEVESVPEADLGLRPDLDVDAVILLNIGRLSTAAAEMLERYHAGGGNVMIVLGDRADARIYNTQILPRLGGLRLENVVGDLAGESWFSLLPATGDHEIFAGFPVAPGEALTGARFRRFVDVRLGAQSRVLGEFSGGHPALIEEPGLLVFASSLDMRWSDFPTSASYLPFLHRALLQIILQGRIGRQEPRVGEALVFPVPPEIARETLQCAGPDGIDIAAELVQSERGATLRTVPVEQPGFYRIHTGSADGTLRTFAVNVDARESDLTAMTPAEGTLIFGDQAVTIPAGEELSRQVLETRYGRELWRHCLALAFLLLVAESLVARGRLRP